MTKIIILLLVLSSSFARGRIIIDRRKNGDNHYNCTADTDADTQLRLRVVNFEGKIIVENSNGSVEDDGRRKNWFISCVHSTPTEILYIKPVDEGKVGTTFKADHYGMSWTNFYDNSTYTFTSRLNVTFDQDTKNQTFQCQSKENPCLRSRLIVSEEGGRMSFDAILQSKITELKKELDSSAHVQQNEKEECPVKFFYKNATSWWNFMTYAVTCGHPGAAQKMTLTPLNCTTKGRCDAILREKPRLPDHCWSEGECEETEKCGEFVTLHTLTPVVLTCGTGSGSHAESSLMFFGIPTSASKLPQHYISTKNVSNESMIRMSQFGEWQLINSKLRVKCQASTFYTSDSFRFALTFDNRSTVELMPTGEAHYDEVLNVNFQIADIPLTDTSLKEVHCYVGIQNSRQWLHVFRPVRVLDFLPFYEHTSCPNRTANLSKIPPPTFQIQFSKLDVEIKHTFTANNHTFNRTRGTQKWHESIDLSCLSSNYSVLIRHQLNPGSNNKALTKKKDAWIASLNFTNFSQRMSSFEFKIEGNLNLQSVNQTQFFRCESVQDPCLHSNLQYSFNEDKKVYNFALIPPQDNPMPFESQQEPAASDCEVNFYYKKTESNEYEFRCRFPFQQTGGKVKFQYCDSLLDCHNILAGRRQSEDCFKDYTKFWQECHGCPEVKSKDKFRPFGATCVSGGEQTGDHFESHFGSFAYFGVQMANETTPPIFFNETEMEGQDLIFLEEFQPYPLINRSDRAVCRTSKFYTTGDVWSGYTVEGNDSNILNESRASKMDQNSPVTTFNLTFDKEESGNFFCFSPLLARIGWINASRPFRSSVFKELEMTFDKGFVKNGTLELSISAGSENSITCTLSGFPPSDITFSGPDMDRHHILPMGENKTHRWSTLVFEKIYQKGEKNFTCTAHNSIHKSSPITTDIILHINSEVDVVRIGTTLSLIVVGLLLIIVGGLALQQFTRWKSDHRNLTQKEYYYFWFGKKNRDDPNDIHRLIHSLEMNKKFNISRDQIDLVDGEEGKIGAGKFGCVVKGGYTHVDDKGNKWEKVSMAFKTVGPHVGIEEFKALLSEIKILAYLHDPKNRNKPAHPNILFFKGVCAESIRKRKVWAAVELCENGDLLKYLRKHKPDDFKDQFNPSATPSLVDGNQYESFYANDGDQENVPMNITNTSTEPMTGLTTTNLLRISQQIACGMAYLTTRKVIHGDLAARNVLLTAKMDVKICDFGLARQLKKRQHKLIEKQEAPPWKWRALETLKKEGGNHSIWSDVWSFGIVLHEIFSLGKEPYPEVRRGGPLFVKFLMDGGRMPKPPYADEKIYALMRHCWDQTPEYRPAFKDIELLLADIEETIGLSETSETSEDET